MRKFKLLNVVKETDDNNKANKLLALGYAEITGTGDKETTEDKGTVEDKAAKKPRSRKADSGGDGDGEPEQTQDPAGD